MKKEYPVIFKKYGKWYVVSVPDFPTQTQGRNMKDALFMAWDVIGFSGIILEDKGRPIPEPSPIESFTIDADETISMVEVDFVAYREHHDAWVRRRNRNPFRLIPYLLGRLWDSYRYNRYNRKNLPKQLPISE